MGDGWYRHKGHFAMKRARRLDFPLSAAGGRLRRPFWRSLEAAVAWRIDTGLMAPGSRVPSTRTLARQLGLSRNTVALAFESLAADGYLGSRVGDGTYVLDRTYRARPPLWERRRQWIRDPDGLLIWMVT